MHRETSYRLIWVVFYYKWKDKALQLSRCLYGVEISPRGHSSLKFPRQPGGDVLRRRQLAVSPEDSRIPVRLTLDSTGRTSLTWSSAETDHLSSVLLQQGGRIRSRPLERWSAYRSYRTPLVSASQKTAVLWAEPLRDACRRFCVS